MASDTFRIVFDEDGYPRELSTPEERRRAVRDGSIAADTIVTIYRSGAAPVAVEAASVPELQHIFANPAAQRSSGPTSLVASGQASLPEARPVESPIEPSGVSSDGSPSLEGDHEIPDLVGESLGPYHSDDDYTPTIEEYGADDDHRPSRWPQAVAFAFVALGLILASLLIFDFESGEQATAQSFIVVRTTNVRDQPTSLGSVVVAQMDRGDTVTGIPGAGSNANDSWLEISEGPYRGHFLWMRNLEPVPRDTAEGAPS